MFHHIVLFCIFGGDDDKQYI